MTGWAWVSVVVIAACVGSVVALLTDWLRCESRRMDADLADISDRIDQAHRTGTHARRGGRGDCVVCGQHERYGDAPFGQS